MIPGGRKFRISTPPSSFKTVAMIFTVVGITLNFFFLGNMALLHWLPLGVWFRRMNLCFIPCDVD
jgi:hypothetical protein